MKFGIPWKSKGARPESQDRAGETAARAGMPADDALIQTINRLDERLARLMQQTPHETLHGPAMAGEPFHASAPHPSAPYAQPPRDAAPPYAAAAARLQPADPWSAAINQAIAEISSRQQLLDTPPAARAAMPHQPQPGSDLSALQQQLRQITDEIRALRMPAIVENITAMRSDLAEIARALTHAMPRRAIEMLENEVHNLAERVDHTRQCGADPDTIASLERALTEVRDELRSLTPAEHLRGFDEAVRVLSGKIDQLATANTAPSTLQQLEAAITALRGVVSHVASNDTLTQLAEDMRGLSAKIDHLENSGKGLNAGSFSTLEERIAGLTEQIRHMRENGGFQQLTSELQALSTKIDRIEHSSQDVGLTLERKITSLTEEMSSGRAAPLPPRLETFLEKFSSRLERAEFTSSEQLALGNLEDRIVALAAKLDASDARLNHLGAIERGMAELLVHLEALRDRRSETRTPPIPNVLRTELSRTQDSLEAVHGTVGTVVDRLATLEAERREEAKSLKAAIPAAKSMPPATRPAPPAAEQPAPHAPKAPEIPPQSALPPQQRLGHMASPPLDPSLPPDFPLEPGSGVTRERASGSAAERIAASQAALGPAQRPESGKPGSTNFIAAARRAAQAATPSADAADMSRPETDEDIPGKSISHRMRSLLVTSSIVLIAVIGGRVAMDIWAPKEIASIEMQAMGDHVAGLLDDDEDTPQTTPAITHPQQSAALPQPEARASADIVTGTVPQASAPLPPASQNPLIPLTPAEAKLLPADKFPAALRNAAAAGDPAAAHEVAIRYLEGRDVQLSLEDAARWFERAAKAGVAPAQFRLGSMYEKGQGVKKSLQMARDLYQAAADKGNAKAMHNLAVLYAEGAATKPDYATAAQWFRKAAERGVPDSQYNLAILYSRGIGVERNFAEAYKWFSLSAAQGDREAAKKRDDVGSRLDLETLNAARLAAQAFRPQPQPEDAMEVKAPEGGWDNAATAARPAPRKPQPGESSNRPAPMRISPS